MTDKQLQELKEQIKNEVLSEIQVSKNNKHMIGPYAEVRKKYTDLIKEKFTPRKGYKIMDASVQIMKNIVGENYLSRFTLEQQELGADFLEQLYEFLLNYKSKKEDKPC